MCCWNSDDVLLRFHALRRTGEVLRKLERPPRAVSWQLGVGLDVGLEAGACPRHAQKLPDEFLGSGSVVCFRGMLENS